MTKKQAKLVLSIIIYFETACLQLVYFFFCGHSLRCAAFSSPVLLGVRGLPSPS